jgi:hypothetical protein
VPRHVVLLTRDTSLAVALEAMLDEHDRLSRLTSSKEWKGLDGSPVDVVVVDLPASVRKSAIEVLERKFAGPLIVLLGQGEDPGKAAARERRSVLGRPFGISELWSLLIASHSRGTSPVSESASDTEVLPVVEAAVAAPAAAVGPAAVAEPAAAEPAAVAAPAAADPGPAEPAWRWRRRRFQNARGPLQAGELTEPMPPVEIDSNGSGSGTPVAAVPPAGSTVKGTKGASASNGQWLASPGASEAEQWDVVDKAPEAVATRLAERLQADVVALLLDNGQGLLETAGGVGLARGERRLQVEYGHEVLRELFRVGVGLIDDTERASGIIGSLPFGRADSLMMVPLMHERHGFGVLLAGRYRRRPGRSRPEFTELEIEALMDFAEDVAPALRSVVLLHRLKGQLKRQPKGEGEAD